MRILFISPEEGAPVSTGGGQRTRHLFRALSTLGEVDVLVSAECWPTLEAGLLARCTTEFAGARQVRLHRSTPSFVYPPDAGSALWRAGSFAVRRVRKATEPRRLQYRPTAAAAKALDALIDDRRYDVIVGRFLRQTAVSGALDQSRVPVVCDLDDLDESVLRARVEATPGPSVKRLLARWQLDQVARFAPALRTRCAHVWVASEADRALVKHRSVSVLANIPHANRGFPVQPTATPPDHRIALFVGSFVHPVNRAGVLDFVAHVWPVVHRRWPDARFRIVGSGGWDGMADALGATPGIEVIGAVDDFAVEYAQASFAVVPVKLGGGTKIKVVEALAYGRPVVAAAHAVRGFESLVGAGVVSAASDAEMADACCAWFASPQQRDAVAAQGHARVRASFSYERFEEEVVHTLRHVTRATQPRRALAA